MHLVSGTSHLSRYVFTLLAKESSLMMILSAATPIGPEDHATACVGSQAGMIRSAFAIPEDLPTYMLSYATILLSI